MSESEYVACAIQCGEETQVWTILQTSKLQLETHFGYHSAAKSTFKNLKLYVLKSALSYHFQSVMIVAFIGSLNFTLPQSQHLRISSRFEVGFVLSFPICDNCSIHWFIELLRSLARVGERAESQESAMPQATPH
jgi:hypothetical protein